MLPSNTAVQSTERDGGELNRAEMQAAGRRNKTQRDGRTLGYRAEEGRITEVYCWALVGKRTCKCRAELCRVRRDQT